MKAASDIILRTPSRPSADALFQLISDVSNVMESLGSDSDAYASAVTAGSIRTERWWSFKASTKRRRLVALVHEMDQLFDDLSVHRLANGSINATVRTKRKVGHLGPPPLGLHQRHCMKKATQQGWPQRSDRPGYTEHRS